MLKKFELLVNLFGFAPVYKANISAKHSQTLKNPFQILFSKYFTEFSICFRTLLELGASPNYKDAKGLTAVYLSVTKKTDAKLTKALLHDHAVLGTQDTQGWQEIHQACRNGLVEHLDHLLTYGADMDSRNASGNTPLHVCAVNKQTACAKMLLQRGAQRDALNFANQTPYQVAVIADNLKLAEIIQSFSQECVGKSKKERLLDFFAFIFIL